jgi:chromosome segregation protein
MRFEALVLDRYGHFTDKCLDLSGHDIRLHIVHGRNEAGKSTILAAIADLLFGFPARTGFNFLHDYESLRLSGTIVSRNGEKLGFKRRKGNARTLRSEADQVLPECTLLPFLGGADRAVFERMFGLDHQRLRDSGRRMMEADGDLGRSLFEAGSGLDGVDQVLGDLEGEIDLIGRPERKSSKKRLWAAADCFIESQRAKRDSALRREEFETAERTLVQAIEAKTRINDELASIRERRNRLERSRRTGRILIEIDRLEHELAKIAEVPDLPPTFEDARRESARKLASAEHGLELAQTAREVAARELDSIPAERIFTPFASEIAALQDRLGEYTKGIEDEPKLARDIARYDDEIARHVTELGLGFDPAGAEALMPKKPFVAKVGAAIRKGDQLRAQLGKAQQDARQAEAEVLADETDLAKPDETEDPTLAISFIDAATRVGDVASALAEGRNDLARARRALAEAESRLPNWTRGMEALAATGFPTAETIRDHEERLQQLVTACNGLGQTRDEAETEIKAIDAAILALEAEGDIPTAEVLAAARDQRDALWRRLRHLIAPDPDRPEEDIAGDDLVEDYEFGVRRADALADRKVTEAERVARFEDLRSRRVFVAGRAETTSARLREIERDLEQLSAAWEDSWLAAGARADRPAAMRAFLVAKDEALRCLADERRAEERLARLEENETRVRVLLSKAARALGLNPDSAATFDDLEQQVRAAAKIHETAWKKKLGRAETLARLRRTFETKRTEAEQIEQALRTWTDEWSLLVAELHLAHDAGPEEAAAMLEIWDRMRDPSTHKTTALRRLEGLRADLADFRRKASAVVGKIATTAGDRGANFDLDSSAEPEVIVRGLRLRLDEEMLRLAKRADLEQRRDGAERSFEAATAALDSARNGFSDLCTLHGLEPAADLGRLCRLAEEKRTLIETLKGRREDLAKDSEGFDEHALREQCRSVSPDAAAAEVAALEASETELVPKGQAAAQAETAARGALEALRTKTGAAEADARGRDAALAFADHTERWLLLETARQLLLRAIERYRIENEDPLIGRTSALFAEIAAGAENPITHLFVDYRDGRAPVIVGKRADGRCCEVADMSEGTRDQLFLCLRIAAIELYAKEREPLPFIADDLFVTSDDFRVISGLAVLAELGRTTQVILFTHHRQIVEAAASLPAGSFRVHELSRCD